MSQTIDTSLSTSPAFRRDVTNLLGLTVDELKALDNATRTSTGFAETAESVSTVSRAIERSLSDTATILKVCEFLYAHSRHQEVAPSGLVGEIEALALDLGVDVEAKKGALLSLFQPRESYDQARLRRVYQARGAPALARLRLACDMRAVLSDDQGKMLGFAPVVIGEISTTKPGSLDRDYLAFQISEKRLEEIKEEIEAAIRVLRELKRDFADKLLPDDSE